MFAATNEIDNNDEHVNFAIPADVGVSVGGVEAVNTNAKSDLVNPAASDHSTADANIYERAQISPTAADNEIASCQIQTTVCLLRLPRWLSRSGVAGIGCKPDNCRTSCCSCNCALLAQQDSLGDGGSRNQNKDDELARRLLNTLGGGTQAHSLEDAKAKQIQICKSVLPDVLPLSAFVTKHLVGGMIIIQPEHLHEAVACSQRQQVIICLELAVTYTPNVKQQALPWRTKKPGHPE